MKLLTHLLLLSLASLTLSSLTLVCEDVLKIPVDTQYQYSLTANGGKAPYSFTATGLPEGITVVGGAIVGKSNVVGVFPVVVGVSDGDKTAANKHIFVFVTSPTSTGGNSVSQITTTTTTRTSGGTGTGVGDNRSQSLQSGSSQSSQSFQSSQQTGQSGLFSNNNQISSSGIQASQYPIGSSSFNNQQQFTLNGVNINSLNPQPQTGTIVLNTQNLNSQNYRPPVTSQPSSNNSPLLVTTNPLIVPTTSPYITNYNFASSLQSTPSSTSAQSVQTAFQRQTNINKAISSLLSIVQGYNTTLLNIQSNIPGTTQLLNEAIKNQRVAQAQVNSLITQNNSISNNISGLEDGIKTLQSQVLTTTNTLNNSNAQVQTYQNKITQNYIQINQTKNKIQQATNSLRQAESKKDKAEAYINYSRDIILKSTQNITSIQNDINNAPVLLAKYKDQANNQKTVILALQKQLEAAILALVPIQAQVQYYSLIPALGPGLIQQNKTILTIENQNLNQAQPIYISAKNDMDTYSNLVQQLTSSMNSLQNQLAADQLAYDNIIGSQSNQEGLFNNTLITIASQTQLLNRMRAQQQNLLSGQYAAALQVVSDTTSKVNLLTQTVNSLNRKYTQVQGNMATAQQSLNEAIRQKEVVDQSVNQLIQGGSSTSSSSIMSSLGTGSGRANINIEIKKN